MSRTEIVQQGPVMSLAEMREVAEAMVASGLTSFQTPEQALVLMLQAQADGQHPMKAAQEYHIIHDERNNRTYPSLRADAMLARFQRAGGRVRWIERTPRAVEAEFYHPGLVEPVRVRWTLEDAQRAGLANRRSWRQYPRQMLTARVVSEGVRIAYPAVATGIYTPEEVQDFDATPPVRVEAEVVTAEPASSEEIDEALESREEGGGEQAAPTPAQPANDRATLARAVGALFEALGLVDREVNRQLLNIVLEADIQSPSELTTDQLKRAWEYLTALAMAAGDADQSKLPRLPEYVAAVVATGSAPPSDAEALMVDYVTWLESAEPVDE